MFAEFSTIVQSSSVSDYTIVENSAKMSEPTNSDYYNEVFNDAYDEVNSDAGNDRPDGIRDMKDFDKK